MLPGFILGVIVFIFILLMFQALRLTEFVLVHGVSFKIVLRIAGYLTISFLPAVLPMSLLFSVILGYGRLSVDSEIIAFKSLGLNMFHLYLPALILGGVIALLSSKASFVLAPWGNRQFEILITKVGDNKAGITLKEGTFAEGFFDLVIYANQVDSKNGRLTDVFIYDERKAEAPLTIIAKEGVLVQSADAVHKAFLRLLNGNIHRSNESYVKINFDVYDIHLANPINESIKQKTILSLSMDEIADYLKKNQDSHPDYLNMKIEYHKRWAISIGALLFAFVGVGIGARTNRRSVKSGGLALSLGLIILYWILYILGDNMARQQLFPIAPSIWLANIIFLITGGVLFVRSWK